MEKLQAHRGALTKDRDDMQAEAEGLKRQQEQGLQNIQKQVEEVEFKFCIDYAFSIINLNKIISACMWRLTKFQVNVRKQRLTMDIKATKKRLDELQRAASGGDSSGKLQIEKENERLRDDIQTFRSLQVLLTLSTCLDSQIARV